MSFDDDAPIPWPKKDDKLFRPSSGDWRYDAMPRTVLDPDSAYSESYKGAGDIAVQHVVDQGHRFNEQDILVFPIGFLYRHYLELSLKWLIREGRDLWSNPPPDKVIDGRSGVLNRHELDDLWTQCRALLLDVLSPGERDMAAVKAVDDIITEYVQYDRVAQAFRFPTTRDGKRHLTTLGNVDLRNLRNVMAGVAVFLSGAHDAIDAHRQAKYEAEREYQE